MQRTELAAMSREELETWGWRQHELARELANRLGADSRTSSRPPSSDDPYRGDGGDGKPPATPAGKTGKPDEKSAEAAAGNELPFTTVGDVAEMVEKLVAAKASK